MTTTAQAAANAANAQLSTGPRTEAGKARSSRNAVSHGLCSAQNFIMPGEESAFASMHDTLLDQLAPADGVEMFQFEIALHASWGIRRCRLIETSLMQANGPEALVDPQHAKSFDRLDRYATHHQRAFEHGAAAAPMEAEWAAAVRRSAGEGEDGGVRLLLPSSVVLPTQRSLRPFRFYRLANQTKCLS